MIELLFIMLPPLTVIVIGVILLEINLKQHKKEMVDLGAKYAKSEKENMEKNNYINEIEEKTGKICQCGHVKSLHKAINGCCGKDENQDIICCYCMAFKSLKID